MVGAGNQISFQEWCEINTEEIERQINEADHLNKLEAKKKEDAEFALKYSIYLNKIFGLPNEKLTKHSLTRV